MIYNEIMRTIVKDKFISFLRCGNKCICYQRYNNNHLKLTNDQITELYSDHQNQIYKKMVFYKLRWNNTV